MSAISLKSITGITSITTPAGVDNQLTLHTNNTTERLKIDVAGNVHVNNHLAVTGVTTTSDDINIPVTNKKLKIGASQQLQLYNQGYHSRIDHVGNHWLSIRSNAIGLFDASDNYFLDGLASTGALRLYFNNSVKLETRSNGVNVTGRIFCDGSLANNRGLIFNDNVKISLGSSNDLEIYHDSSNSYLDNTGTGDFYIRGNNVNSIILRPKQDENSIIANSNGDVELYYNNVKRLETTSTGVSVTTASSANSVKNITTSTSTPSGGSDGDLWFTYVA